MFIDEAYSLTDNGQGQDQYGTEAVNTLLKLMEDHRDDLIVIVAGTPSRYRSSSAATPASSRRFNKFLHFDDYAPAELTEIFRHFAASGDYTLHPATELKLTMFSRPCTPGATRRSATRGSRATCSRRPSTPTRTAWSRRGRWTRRAW